MTEYQMVPLSRVLRPSRDEIPVEPLETYHCGGIYSFGRGLFRKPSLTGAETSYSKFYRLHQDQFVYSRLFAWEGAFAVVTPEFDGLVVSHEFPTFEIDRDRAEPEYLSWICRWPWFWEEMVGRTKGLGVRRQRVHPERVLETRIPLPDPLEQKRVAAWLNTIDERLTLARHLVSASHYQSEFVIDAALRQLFAQRSWSTKPLAEFCDINPSPIPKADLGQDLTISFVPMSAIDDHTGTIASPEPRALSTVGSGYKQFLDGDVIFARITPCMQNGKSAVARKLENGIGYGSTEFHVLRPGPELNVNWLHYLLRSKDIRDAAESSFKGTAGQQRVPTSFLENLVVPMPSPDEQRLAVSFLDHIRERIQDIHDRRARSSVEMKALIPATLNSLLGTNL